MDDLLALLKRARPAMVRAHLADGSTRELKPPTDTRKRWEPILQLLGQLAPARVELFAEGGELVAVWPTQDAPIDQTDPEEAPSDAPHLALDAAADRYLQRLVAAQREALSWQDRSVRTALDAVVAVMNQLGGAIAAISQAHQLERDQLRAALQDAPAQDSAPEASQRDAILAQLAPVIAAKLLAPPAPQPAAPAKKPPTTT